MQLDSEFKRAAEHFLNLPRDSKGLTSDECPLAGACVLTAILYDFKILQAKENTDASKLVALKSLGHWVGDIHQPLHVSFLDDKGGNTIRTTVSGKSSRGLGYLSRSICGRSRCFGGGNRSPGGHHS
jgi:hypothetical protein